MMTTIFMKKIIFFCYVMSFTFLFNTNHPLFMGLLIITQSILISIIISMNFNLNWFSFMIFMIYLGGILMLFSYVISISFSKQPLMKKNIMPLLGMIILLLFNQEETFMEFKKMKITKMLMIIYHENKNLTLILTSLLFFIMTSVIFITETEKMSSKKK